MPDARKYSDAEVREIIERALKTEDAPASAITHGDLLAIGEQVGVTPEVMVRAAREVSEAKLELSATSAIKSRRRKLLTLHAALFAVVNGLLFTVNALTTPGEWWVLFPVFFWGLALALHAGAALGLSVSKGAVERERSKQARLRVASEPVHARIASDAPDETESEPEERATRSL